MGRVKQKGMSVMRTNERREAEVGGMVMKIKGRGRAVERGRGSSYSQDKSVKTIYVLEFCFLSTSLL